LLHHRSVGARSVLEHCYGGRLLRVCLNQGHTSARRVSMDQIDRPILVVELVCATVRTACDVKKDIFHQSDTHRELGVQPDCRVFILYISDDSIFAGTTVWAACAERTPATRRIRSARAGHQAHCYRERVSGQRNSIGFDQAANFQSDSRAT
jgi:hypothetical protein